jgi:hypothetical protein
MKPARRHPDSPERQGREGIGVVTAWSDGWRRALSAPWIVAGLWLITLLMALPLALALRSMLAAHLGTSLAAETAATGVNFDWWNEFLAQAAGIGQTFVPAILGFAAVMKNLSTIADAGTLPPLIASVVTAHILVSVFVLGGVLDRLARNRATGSAAFFSACGVFFFRFLRLGVIAALLYWWLFAWLHPMLFERLYTRLTHDLSVERTAFAYRLMLYVVFAALLLGVNLMFDYAKIRMVVEDRRSAIGALVASVRFIARQPGAAAALYLLNTLAFAVVLALYALLVPGAAGGTWAWIALLIGQVYIVLRVIVRLIFAASQIALFQGRLAHAGYTAASVPAWPESPAAEAVRPIQ